MELVDDIKNNLLYAGVLSLLSTTQVLVLSKLRYDVVLTKKLLW